MKKDSPLASNMFGQLTKRELNSSYKLQDIVNSFFQPQEVPIDEKLSGIDALEAALSGDGVQAKVLRLRLIKKSFRLKDLEFDEEGCITNYPDDELKLKVQPTILTRVSDSTRRRSTSQAKLTNDELREKQKTSGDRMRLATIEIKQLLEEMRLDDPDTKFKQAQSLYWQRYRERKLLALTEVDNNTIEDVQE